MFSLLTGELVSAPAEPHNERKGIHVFFLRRSFSGGPDVGIGNDGGNSTKIKAEILFCVRWEGQHPPNQSLAGDLTVFLRLYNI